MLEQISQKRIIKHQNTFNQIYFESGYLENQLIAQSSIQEVHGTDMLVAQDSRTSKIKMGEQSQQQQNQLDLFQISNALPQISFLQQNDRIFIDLINQIKKQARVVRMYYQT